MYKLLEERSAARREQNWKEADRILEVLQTEHNVQVYDGFAPMFARVISRQSSAPLNVLKERFEKLYGPNCHPYTHVGPPELNADTCPLTMNDIHNALTRRVWLKSEKRFIEADAQLYELMTYGIEVNDNYKQWRSDGKVLFDKEWSRPPPQELPYKEITSLILPERTRVRVKQLVKQRAIALARFDANLAAALEVELRRTYLVVVDDFDFTWRVKAARENDSMVLQTPPSTNDLFRTSCTSHLPTMAALDPEHNWTKGGPYRYNEIVSSESLSPYEESRVLNLLMQRDELRSIGHYLEADFLVKELWCSYVVDVHDARRQYSVGRSFAQYYEDEAFGTTSERAARGEGMGLDRNEGVSLASDEMVSDPGTQLPRWWDLYQESGLARELDRSNANEVENLIKYLSSQQQRNPNIVDRLMVRLEEEYGLLFDGSTWKLKGKIQRYAPDRSRMQKLPESGLMKIQELVDMRNEQMFRLKNTGMADILEAGLKSKFNVVISDEKQVWYIEEPSMS